MNIGTSEAYLSLMLKKNISMGTFVPVSTYCRVLSIYINMSDIRMIKMIVNASTALAPILPYFDRETFLEPKCEWALGRFSKTL